MKSVFQIIIIIIIIVCIIFIIVVLIMMIIIIIIITNLSRFGWRSTEAGLVPIFYDISGLPMLLLVGYFGGRAHKPRWIAAGMILIGLGSLLFALPHFTTGPYDTSYVTPNLF